MADKQRRDPLEIRLPNGIDIKLRSLGTFDGVGLAEEIVGGLEILLSRRPNDRVFIDRVCRSLENACNELKDVERGQEIIDVLNPLLEKVKSLQKQNLPPSK